MVVAHNKSDLFEEKAIKPMLIKELKEPFNSPDWLYELKLDGIRCIAYIDESSADLRNKRNMNLINKFPELIDINKQVKEKCILDGELIVIKDGVPDFYEVQRRAILTDSFKVKMAANRFPTSFVVYDILYYKNKDITDLQLIERKALLEDTIIENSRIAISRYIEENGIELFQLADERKLEGVVAKKKNSMYHFDKRSKDWIKFKRMADENFVICGYVRKRPLNSLILGQYKGEKLVYKGSVSFGVRLNILQQYNCVEIPYSPFSFSITE